LFQLQKNENVTSILESQPLKLLFIHRSRIISVQLALLYSTSYGYNRRRHFYYHRRTRHCTNTKILRRTVWYSQQYKQKVKCASKHLVLIIRVGKPNVFYCYWIR